MAIFRLPVRARTTRFLVLPLYRPRTCKASLDLVHGAGFDPWSAARAQTRTQHQCPFEVPLPFFFLLLRLALLSGGPCTTGVCMRTSRLISCSSLEFTRITTSRPSGASGSVHEMSVRPACVVLCAVIKPLDRDRVVALGKEVGVDRLATRTCVYLLDDACAVL